MKKIMSLKLKQILSNQNKFIFISVVTYLIFFSKLLSSDYFFWGSDAKLKFYPTRVYLYEKITKEFEFPFWTEKLFSGFPIYADPEHSYLHPINVLFILLFGPVNSYKILHFILYLLGSVCFYKFLERKGINLLGAVCANLIFYFNMFMLNHQIHFTIIMSLYLLPCAFLLVDKFLESPKFIYAFLQALVLVNSILWGHLQSTVIIFMGIFLYVLFLGYKKIPLSSFIKYVLIVPVLSVLLSLYQIIPAFDLYTNSYREEGFDFRFGTFSRSLLATSFVPYILGTHTNKSFIGDTVGTSVTYTEVYIYFGITTAILMFFIFFFQKKTRDFYFTYASILIFLAFIFIGYIGLFFDGFPIISMFRYWVRFLVIPLFGVSFLIAKLLSDLDTDVSAKNIFMGFAHILGIFIFIQGIFLFSLKDDKYIGLYNLLSPKSLLLVYPFGKIFYSLIFCLLLCLVLYLFFNKLKLYVKYLIVTLVFFDLFYFSYDVLNFRIAEYKNFVPKVSSIDLPNTRVIDATLNLNGNEFLFMNSYSPFGYSQLRDARYVREISEAGIINVIGDVNIPNFENLKDLGIYKFKSPDGKETTLFKNYNFPLRSTLPISNLIKNESSYQFKVNLSEDTNIKTFIKYDKNWKVQIDGVDKPVKEYDLMLEISLPKGEHSINMYYFPTNFYYSFLVSMMFMTVSIVLIRRDYNLS